MLFERVSQGFYNLANDIEPREILSTGYENEYVCPFSDDFGRIIFKLIETENDKIVYIIDILWDYKNQKDSWWHIVENDVIKLTYEQKK